MKIMKILMCIAMLFVVACDSDSGGLTPTADNLQGTWNVTNTCFSGTFPGYDYEDYDETFIGCQTIPSGTCVDTMEEYGFQEWAIIEDDVITWCNDEMGYEYCDDDPDTFILSGSTLTIFDSDGDSESASISLSSDGDTATTVQTVAEYGCSATITQTWVKQ